MNRPPVNARHAKVTVDLPQTIKQNRAEAARRRAIVAATLAGLTLTGLALLISGVLPVIAGWAACAVPAAGLAAAVVVGRRAALASQRSDEEYLARLRERQEQRIHPRAVSRPVADLAQDEQRDQRVRAAAPARPAAPARREQEPRAPRTDEHASHSEAGEWTPVEVPKPSYVTKPKAPRWVPEPLAIEGLDGSDAGLSHTVLSTGAAAAGSEDGPKVQYTELDLDAIMERRRVV